MKITLIYIAYTIGGLSTAYLLIMYLLSTNVTTSSNETWNAMQKSPFDCPKGTEITYHGWSENGQLRYCEPVKNGPWEAWMSGYKHVQGTYKNGQKDGKWIWFNKDGSVNKTIFYENGIEQQNGTK